MKSPKNNLKTIGEKIIIGVQKNVLFYRKSGGILKDN